jgi:NFACT protein RNA binding domain
MDQDFLSFLFPGNKVNNVDVVYTPWFNLKKTPSMEVGQVGFHNPKMVMISLI